MAFCFIFSILLAPSYFCFIARLFAFPLSVIIGLGYRIRYGGKRGQLLFNSYSLLNGEPSLGHELGLGLGPVEFSWILGLLCWGRICLTKINKYEFIAAIVHFRLRGVIVYEFIYTHSILVCLCMCVIKLKANARCDHINKCINCVCVCVCELPLFYSEDKRHRNTLSHKKKNCRAFLPQVSSPFNIYKHTNTSRSLPYYMHVRTEGTTIKTARETLIFLLLWQFHSQLAEFIHNALLGVQQSLRRFYEFCHALDFKFCRC